MNALKRLAAAVALLTLLGGVNAASANVWGFHWHTRVGRGNPLVGRVWVPARQNFLGPVALVPRLGRARFVILGERHDNPDHHLMQARLLQGLVQAGRRPALAFEMINIDQSPALARFLGDSPHSATGLGRALRWHDHGWPAWTTYEPIAQVAINHQLPIVAAELPLKTVRAVMQHGLSALMPDLIHRLRLRRPWPAARTAAMQQRMQRDHCGLLPPKLLPGMALAQRLRNAFMALRLQKAETNDGAVLITGAGHARTDAGVPLALREQGVPARQIISVAMVEVQPGNATPNSYAREFGASRLPFDYVVFTPAARRTDPCVRLRRRFGKRHAAKGER